MDLCLTKINCKLLFSKGQYKQSKMINQKQGEEICSIHSELRIAIQNMKV